MTENAKRNNLSLLEIWRNLKTSVAKDKERRQKFFNRLRNVFGQKRKPKAKPLKKVPKGPVTYIVKNKMVAYKGRRKVFWRRPTEKQFRRFSYRSNCDLVERDWQSFCSRLSDRHPIVYNGSLLTTTKTARIRLRQLRNKPKVKGRKRTVSQTTRKVTVVKQFEMDRHTKTFYAIKKEIHVELNPDSIAQWRHYFKK